MSQMITLCLGMVILAFIIPSQVHSQSTVKSSDTNGTSVSQNSSSSATNSSGLSPAMTSTNTSIPHSHADALYTSSALLLSVASISLLKLCS